MAFTDCTEQQIPRPIDKNRRKIFYSGKKKRHTIVKNQITVNNRGYILHKVGYKKGRKHDYNVYKNNHPIVIPKDILNVVDLGYLGVETDFPEQLSSHYHIKRKEIKNCHKKKKITTEFMLMRE
jgi:DDE superfamily endonuclease